MRYPTLLLATVLGLLVVVLAMAKLGRISEKPGTQHDLVTGMAR